MGFFDDIPTRPRPPEEPRYRQPEWSGPPANMLPGVFAARVILAGGADTAIWVSGGGAYPTGVSLQLHLRAREAMTPDRRDPLFQSFDRQDEDGLRIGVELSDGRRALLGDGPPEPGGHGPALVARGGGGGSDSWDQDLWLWPLPPPGRLTLACRWPARGVAEETVTLDAGPLLAAAMAAEELWPDDRPPPPGHGI